MGKDFIPDQIDLTKVKLTPRGFIYLVLAFAVVMIAAEGAKWLVGKIKGGAKAVVPPQAAEKEQVIATRRGI